MALKWTATGLNGEEYDSEQHSYEKIKDSIKDFSLYYKENKFNVEPNSFIGGVIERHDLKNCSKTCHYIKLMTPDIMTCEVRENKIIYYQRGYTDFSPTNLLDRTSGILYAVVGLENDIEKLYYYIDVEKDTYELRREPK